MALEDRIRPSVETAVSELSTRLDKDVRAVVQQLITVALEERDEALAAARQTFLDEASADVQRRIDEAEARAAETAAASIANARILEREAEMAALTRLLDNIRRLDGATSLSEVLDALGDGAAREASRAAVLVVRQDRVLGWKLRGFGENDAQPRTVDLALVESGVIGVAVGNARPATTRDDEAANAPPFADVPPDRLGFAVPVSVGGRVVAVVYADSVGDDDRPHVVPSGWPEVIEILARHAARCLEAVTVQKAASGPSSRFWASPAAGSSTTASARPAQTSATGASPGVTA